MKTLTEIKELTPGKHGMRLGYIQDACDEVQVKVIKIVRIIFDKKVIEWDESAKSKISVPLFKKCERKCVNSSRGACLLSM